MMPQDHYRALCNAGWGDLWGATWRAALLCGAFTAGLLLLTGCDTHEQQVARERERIQSQLPAHCVYQRVSRTQEGRVPEPPLHLIRCAGERTSATVEEPRQLLVPPRSTTTFEDLD